MKKVGQGLRYSLYVVSHPIEGFYLMRFEGKGNVISCLLLLILMVAAFISNQLYTGFIFNTVNMREFNALREIANVAIPVLLWCMANWSVTVLMDGTGRFVDIFQATAYATVPYTCATLLRVLLSLWATEGEQTFLSIITSIGMVITALLLFTGIMTVHQFTVRRTIFSIILTVAGMVFIVFLAVLFASILDQLIGYIQSLMTEIQLRT